MLKKIDNTIRVKTRRPIWPAIVCAIALLLIALPGMIGFVPVHDDLSAYHLPLRSFYQQALLHDQNWEWCPALFGGYYMHGEGQIGRSSVASGAVSHASTFRGV